MRVPVDQELCRLGESNNAAGTAAHSRRARRKRDYLLLGRSSMWKDFREFAFKGNVIDLAIGVIIGGVFGKTVTAMVNDLIMPFVSLILPSGEWQKAAITLRQLPPEGPEGDARLMLGD